MDLILRRDQRAGGFTGNKISFVLTVKAKITPTEQQAIEKYRMGDTVIYQNYEMADTGKGLLGAISRAAIRASNVHMTVGDLMRGTSIECKDVVEMLGMEQQIKDAAGVFKQVLNAATHFGGEEIISL